MTIHTQPAAIDSIKKGLVALKMPRGLEMLDATLRRVEQGEITWIEAFDQLLIEELTFRSPCQHRAQDVSSEDHENVRGFDFEFQPSLDRNRILALARLKFIDRVAVVHLLGPPGTAKSRFATALAVVFATLADIVTSLAKAKREAPARRLRFPRPCLAPRRR